MAQQDPDKQCFHLCIVNLVIGTLYCAKVRTLNLFLIDVVRFVGALALAIKVTRHVWQAPFEI